MDLRDSIIQIDNLFNEELSKRIIGYLNSVKLDNLNTSAGKNLDVRNVKGKFLRTNDLILKYNNPTDHVFSKLIEKEILKLLPIYRSKFPSLSSNKVTQIDLLKYTVGGKYEIHTDYFLNCGRELTCIINLNEEYEGGELVFFNSYKKEEILKPKLKKRSVIFFPSNFMYPHKINPLTKGKRYSIVSWIS